MSKVWAKYQVHIVISLVVVLLLGCIVAAIANPPSPTYIEVKRPNAPLSPAGVAVPFDRVAEYPFARHTCYVYHPSAADQSPAMQCFPVDR